ncbi:GNAT family N-acetyltransferase [Fictibacillus aquaticus]|uniref:N-acetyltransferase domain-containing protein n=1 Tax=Fictibacillus aquaticus TaxID=2021314 RepID=A0A235F6J4_9BACL|nr:GNAT family N-acetyltransferase [Fictibacillus aquaticus]OYD56849.1 hypothetical protein CGZ90_14945 [Fictibacillus aquaticus]
MSQSFRKLTENDVPEVQALRLEALEKYPDAYLTTKEDQLKLTEDEHRERFRNHNNVQFLTGAFIEGKLVGMMGVMGETREKIKHKATLVAVYVGDQYHGKGIAKKLLVYTLDQAKESGEIEQLQLAVAIENEPAVRLYKNAGFEIYGTEKNALKSGDRYIDEYLMVRFL